MSIFKIATFNVNSVKSRLPILESWLAANNAPDILCLQETKCQDADFPKDFFESLGYKCFFKGMKSYNGIAVISKIEPDSCAFGLRDGTAAPEKEESENARVAHVRFKDLTVINSYIPQGKELEHPDYPYKLAFLGRIKKMLAREHSPSEKLLWVGDLNVAPTDIDVTNPKTTKDHVCFHTSVKEALADVMEWGLVDIFRQHRPNSGEFTFWDYRVKDSLNRNIGWRIDHIIGTQAAAALCRSVTVERDLRAMERPSDHTAVTAELEF